MRGSSGGAGFCAACGRRVAGDRCPRHGDTVFSLDRADEVDEGATRLWRRVTRRSVLAHRVLVAILVIAVLGPGLFALEATFAACGLGDDGFVVTRALIHGVVLLVVANGGDVLAPAPEPAIPVDPLQAAVGYAIAVAIVLVISGALSPVAGAMLERVVPRVTGLPFLPVRRADPVAPEASVALYVRAFVAWACIGLFFALLVASVGLGVSGASEREVMAIWAGPGLWALAATSGTMRLWAALDDSDDPPWWCTDHKVRTGRALIASVLRRPGGKPWWGHGMSGLALLPVVAGARRYAGRSREVLWVRFARWFEARTGRPAPDPAALDL